MAKSHTIHINKGDFVMAIVISSVYIDLNISTVSLDIGFQEYMLKINGIEVHIDEKGEIQLQLPSVWNPSTMREAPIIEFYKSEIELLNFLEKIKKEIIKEKWLMLYLKGDEQELDNT